MSTLSIFLSTAPAEAQWGENALLSFNASSATIHLKESNQLDSIQKAARKLDGLCAQAVLEGDWKMDQQWAFAMGFDNPKKESSVDWCNNDDKAALEVQFGAYHFARNLVNGGPHEIYPESLCDRVQSWLSTLAGDNISFQRWVGSELEEAGWIGVYNVGKGSDRPPVMLEVDFNPTGDTNAPVSAALVGKGITYDSGGYSIKPSETMSFMKCDMGGAATVAAALGLAIQQGLQKRIKMYLCCAENLINGRAYKLGDILTYKNGVSVEILNTDAEGRLVLADGLMAAGESGAPLIIDAATLTGAASVAVGDDYFALLSMDYELQMRALGISRQLNEPGWPLPLEPFHQGKCPSPYADTANSRAVKGGGAGGASNAAGFLSRFVPNNGAGWLHFDLANAFFNSANAKRSAGGTGLGFRTIAKLIAGDKT
ncbi:aminopeptidase PepB [Alteromonas sp. a30]|uniref:aminopeptidase PepB n=1 Tax=Alteromonas sp. a30 TaxID=2730917 RepID=UPI0022826B38|nr:aminopeptidase PepB [Alteromonas sp. a30]MCY7296781.1 aminopeptidase PepB [Alteromonas sp. a30]